MSDDTRHTYYRAIPDNRCIFHRRLFTLGIETIQYRNCPRSSASSKAEPAVYLHFPILASLPPPVHLNPTLLCPPLATGYYSLSIPSRLTSGSLPFHHNRRDISQPLALLTLSTRQGEREGKGGWGTGRRITRTDPPNDSFVPNLQYSYNRSCLIIFRNSDSSTLLVSSVLFRN